VLSRGCRLEATGELAGMTVNSESADAGMEQAGGRAEEGGGLQVMQGVQVGGALHPLVEGQIVVMPNGEQQVVISSGQGGAGHLANGNQVVQVQAGGPGSVHYLLEGGGHLKSEPEDLSFSVGREQGAVLRHSIDLEAGAQAIQASAATAVQNVLRSLKESDKSLLNQILPPHLTMGEMVPQPRVQGEVPGGVGEEPCRPDSGLGDTPEPSGTPNRRSRSAAETQPRVHIAKQYNPFGYHCTLEAPTAQWVRKDEDRCTYMNKGQFYGVTLEYRPNPAEALHNDMTDVKSVVMLVFRDAKNPEDEVNAWEFWHQRQPTSKQRIIDAETNNISDECGISQIEDVSYNAIAVYWNPLQKPAFISVAVQCLSTDFSVQKGVKGLPLHLQVDTYLKSPQDGEYDIVHRAYCQVKVFCDKGAERKFRQEERRATRKVAAGGQRVLDMYHQCQERSEFYSMVDVTRVPVLYTPNPTAAAQQQATFAPMLTAPVVAGTSILKQNGVLNNGQEPLTNDIKRRKTVPPTDTRMVVYVRQENEEIYTPLHLVPPTVPGLARAIESKYNVSANAIRCLYRRNKKGITAKLDDDLLKFYCNEDTFLMQVTAIELEGGEGHESIMYDITLCEIAE
jgi:transcription factor CP2-like protein